MARTIPAAAATEVAKALGTEPIFIVEIDWGGTIGVKSYADRDFDGLEGTIIELSGLDAVIKLGTGGSSADLSIVLDDTDQTLLNILNTVDPQKRPCRVYQTYGAITAADKFLIFDGELASPFTWSEQERTFSFEVVTALEDREIGFSPEEGEFTFIADDAVGKAWPLCFGRPIRVPAVKITEDIRGKSLTRYGAVSFGDLNSLCSAAEALSDAENVKSGADGNVGFSDANYAVVINNVNSAQISLNTTKESLIFDSPTQEGGIEQFIKTCFDLQDNNRNKLFFAAAIVTNNSTITTLEATIVTLTDQIATEQAKTTPDVALIASLKASKISAEASLTAENGSLAANTLALIVANSNIATLEATKELLTSQLTQIVITEIIVDDGNKFPQGVLVNIIVNGLKYSGIFSGETFTISDILPTNTNIVLAPRQNSNANEFWIIDGSIDLRRKYCFISGLGVVLVDNQQGTRCQFSPLLFQQTGTLGTVFGILINGVPSEREIFDQVLLGPGQTISQTSAIIFSSWFANVSSNPDYASGRGQASNFDYNIEIGDDVYLDGDYKDIYIANLIPSTVINEVMGRRIVNGIDKILPIPSSLYTTNLSESIAGQTATTIRLIRPLTGFIDQGWNGEVFVSLESSEGPNTADVIEYLVETYTDLSVDTASFASVSAAIDKYPSDFAILTRQDALAAIETIAWQARCAILIKNGIVFIAYLAAETAPIKTLTESDLTDVSVTLSNTDNLVTKFVAKWKRDLSIEEADEVVLRNNVPKYGLNEQEFDFFIYNNQDLVIKSATFWIIRLSNTWKLVTFTAWLTTLALEAFDIVELDLLEGIIATAAAKGFVEKADYDSTNHSISYQIWTAVLAGDDEEHTLFWPATAPPGTVYPTDKDLFAGGG